jgi:hypothetical protein
LARCDRKGSLNDGQIQNPSNPFGIVPLSNFESEGFWICPSFNSHALSRSANPYRISHDSQLFSSLYGRVGWERNRFSEMSGTPPFPPRPPNPSHTIVLRAEGYTHDARVWASSLVQGPLQLGARSGETTTKRRAGGAWRRAYQHVHHRQPVRSCALARLDQTARMGQPALHAPPPTHGSASPACTTPHAAPSAAPPPPARKRVSRTGRSHRGEGVGASVEVVACRRHLRGQHFVHRVPLTHVLHQQIMDDSQSS